MDKEEFKRQKKEAREENDLSDRTLQGWVDIILPNRKRKERRKMAEEKVRTKQCGCKTKPYIPDDQTLCDYCLVVKFGLGLPYASELVGGWDYYREEDVIKALRKASGL